MIFDDFFRFFFDFLRFWGLLRPVGGVTERVSGKAIYNIYFYIYIYSWKKDQKDLFFMIFDDFFRFFSIFCDFEVCCGPWGGVTEMVSGIAIYNIYFYIYI